MGRGQMSVPPKSQSKVRFGAFELDLRTAELRTNGHVRTLQGQPFQILMVLLERPGELVTREELRKKLWASYTFVDFEHNLNKAVNRLREALHDSAEHPKFVETIPRREYRWIGQIIRNGKGNAPGESGLLVPEAEHASEMLTEPQILTDFEPVRPTRIGLTGIRASETADLKVNERESGAGRT